MATDLEKAFKALDAKARAYSTLWAYYDGNQPLIYSAKRLQNLFRDIDARFSENWCAVIVDTAMDRLDLQRFTVSENPVATTALNRLYEETELNLDSEDAHECALVTGEGYVIAWREDVGDQRGPVECYFNDSRLCHLEYDPAHPRRKLWAAKWWAGEDEIYRLTLYYPERLEYYRASGKGAPNGANQFQPIEGEDWQVPNPFGQVPVFHLRGNRRKAIGELTQSILELQNAVNKLIADMMVAAEFGAFKQRYVISEAEIGQLKNAPNEIWAVPAGDGVGQDTEIGEFSETRLDNFLDAINQLSISMGIISRTPKSLFIKLPSHEISGDALLAMEAPLNKKCERYIQRFTPVWRRIASFLLELEGIGVSPMQIQPEFAKPQTIQPRTQAEIRQINRTAGIPLTTSVREEGWSDARIEQMRRDQQEEASREANLARAYLDQARREMDQEGE